MPVNNTVTLVPCHEDILAVTAGHIIDRATSLPDLTRSVVLLPDLQFAARLRRQLLQQAENSKHSALLGPVITTLEQWLCERYPVQQSIPGRARREIMLVEVLLQHPDVFRGGNPWQLAASLISLFEELTLNRVAIPADLQTFTEQLKSAYGIEDLLPEPLGMEAGIVHRLWKAWHVQLNSEAMIDPGLAMLARLTQSKEHADGYVYYLVGFDSLSSAEQEWITTLLAAGRAECLLHPQTRINPDARLSPLQTLLHAAAPPDHSDPVSACLDAVFNSGSASMAERATTIRNTYPTSPLADHIEIFSASSAEQEARGIDLQVRQWLLDGKHTIGIVTEDRRLARRVRALLERAGVALQDTGGWALSTTSAAAVLEHWLETIEEDFDHQPLLDVLKSPFIFPDDDREQLAELVYRLENDIIRHENIARGLERYRSQIQRRLQRLQQRWTEATATQLLQLLNRLDQAAEPLRKFTGTAAAKPGEILEALRNSLTEMGIWAAFEQDPAGQRIIQEVQLLSDAVEHCDIRMRWTDFRAWLGSALERHDFRPATADSPVLLLTLQQAQLGQYDGLVIAACDREYLPSGNAKSPFFNDPVRQDLGLPVWPDHYAEQLQRFRCLLQRAPRVLLSWHQQADGETRLPSPWLEALCSFHALAWNTRLDCEVLARQLQQPASQVRGHNALPAPQPHGYPRPVLPAALLPESLSVSTHGNLIDCPYKFFAGSGLGLKPREEIKAAFEKAEYGQLVHRALEIFHKGIDSYPGPFTAAVTATNRQAAVTLLEQISDAVFSRELEDNFEHRAWLRRWRALIPDYIRWQIEHQAEWDFSDAEQQASIELPGGRSLHGRLDRIDSSASGTDILDYKTGGIPKQAAVDSGEAVQLPSYALLTPTLPARVEYLKVDEQISNKVCLEGEDLAVLAEGVRQRLVDVLAAIEAGAPLPAWGDAQTCRWCEMDGLCRQQAWLEEER